MFFADAHLVISGQMSVSMSTPKSISAHEHDQNGDSLRGNTSATIDHFTFIPSCFFASSNSDLSLHPSATLVGDWESTVATKRICLLLRPLYSLEGGGDS
jgi:hypothetical protein